MPRPPWLVLDMDEGLLRREPTRAAAVQWCRDHLGPVMERHHYRPGAYSYVFGHKGEDRSTFLFVEHQDAAKAGGWQQDVIDGPAKFPYADRPWDQKED